MHKNNKNFFLRIAFLKGIVVIVLLLPILVEVLVIRKTHEEPLLNFAGVPPSLDPQARLTEQEYTKELFAYFQRELQKTDEKAETVKLFRALIEGNDADKNTPKDPLVDMKDIEKLQLDQLPIGCEPGLPRALELYQMVKQRDIQSLVQDLENDPALREAFKCFFRDRKELFEYLWKEMADPETVYQKYAFYGFVRSLELLFSGILDQIFGSYVKDLLKKVLQSIKITSLPRSAVPVVAILFFLYYFQQYVSQLSKQQGGGFVLLYYLFSPTSKGFLSGMRSDFLERYKIGASQCRLQMSVKGRFFASTLPSSDDEVLNMLGLFFELLFMVTSPLKVLFWGSQADNNVITTDYLRAVAFFSFVLPLLVFFAFLFDSIFFDGAVREAGQRYVQKGMTYIQRKLSTNLPRVYDALAIVLRKVYGCFAYIGQTKFSLTVFLILLWLGFSKLCYDPENSFVNILNLSSEDSLPDVLPVWFKYAYGLLKGYNELQVIVCGLLSGIRTIEENGGGLLILATLGTFSYDRYGEFQRRRRFSNFVGYQKTLYQATKKMVESDSFGKVKSSELQSMVKFYEEEKKDTLQAFFSAESGGILSVFFETLVPSVIPIFPSSEWEAYQKCTFEEGKEGKKKYSQQGREWFATLLTLAHVQGLVSVIEDKAHNAQDDNPTTSFVEEEDATKYPSWKIEGIYRRSAYKKDSQKGEKVAENIYNDINIKKNINVFVGDESVIKNFLQTLGQVIYLAKTDGRIPARSAKGTLPDKIFFVEGSSQESFEKLLRVYHYAQQHPAKKILLIAPLATTSHDKEVALYAYIKEIEKLGNITALFGADSDSFYELVTEEEEGKWSLHYTELNSKKIPTGIMRQGKQPPCQAFIGAVSQNAPLEMQHQMAKRLQKDKNGLATYLGFSDYVHHNHVMAFFFLLVLLLGLFAFFLLRKRKQDDFINQPPN